MGRIFPVADWAARATQGRGGAQTFGKTTRPASSVDATKTLNIQPNPNNGTFTISAHSLSSLETTKLIIYNTTGQQIFTRELDPQQDIFEINMPEIPTGMYIVKLISGTNIYEQKLIIE